MKNIFVLLIERKWKLLIGTDGFGVNEITTAKALSETERQIEKERIKHRGCMPQQHSYLHAQRPLVDRQHVKWTGEGGH